MKLTACLLSMFAISLGYDYVVNTSTTDTIHRGCPAGRDTGRYAVPQYLVGNATSVATIADSLTLTTLNPNPAKRGRWTIVLRYRPGTGVTDTLARTATIVTIGYTGVTTTKTINVIGSTAKDSVAAILCCRVRSAVFTGRQASDSFALYADPGTGAKPITRTSEWSFPFVGLAYYDILPRQYGPLNTTSPTDAYLPAGSRSGQYVCPGSTTASCTTWFTLPDSGWVIGRTKAYYTSAGLHPIILSPIMLRLGSGAPLASADTLRRGLGLVSRGTFSHSGESLAVDTAAMPHGGGTGTPSRTSWFQHYVGVPTASQVSAPWTSAGVWTGNWLDTTGIADADHPGVLVGWADGIDGGVMSVLAHNCLRLAGKESSHHKFSTRNLDSIFLYLGLHDFDGAGGPSLGPYDGVYGYVDSAPGAGNWARLRLATSTAYSRSYSATSYSLAESTWYEWADSINANATRAYGWLYSDAGALLWRDSLDTNIPTSLGNEVGCSFVALCEKNYGRRPFVLLDWAELIIGR